jgi:N-acetylglucosamine malate deacetylase 1
MKLDFSKERVLAVVAHPDDAELLCAGTLARAKSDGAAIAICVMCNGDKGQPAKAIKNLATVRRKEMLAAAKVVGARLFTCGYPDGTLMDGVAQRRKLIEVFRVFRPTLVFAHSPNDYHADHRAASAIAEAASWLSASKGYKTRSPALPCPPALWWMDTINLIGFEAGFYIEISNHVQVKERMLLCHESQLTRGKEARFTPLVALMKRQCQMRGAQAEVSAAEAFRIHAAFKRARAW